MNRLAGFVLAAAMITSGAALAQSNDNYPPAPPRFDEQTAQLPTDSDSPVDLQRQNAPADRAFTPNTPMQNGGLPNGEGGPTGANTLRE